MIVIFSGCSKQKKQASEENQLPNFDTLWNYQYPDSTEIKFRALIPETKDAGDRDHYLQLLMSKHNYHIFFIMSTRKITQKYIEFAYPKVNTCFDELMEFIELERYFIPDVKKDSIKRAYTLWSHKENGFADYVYKLNKIIWWYFEKEDFRKTLECIFNQVPDLQHEFANISEKSLSGGEDKLTGIWAYYFTTGDGMSLEMYWGNSSSFNCEGTINLFELLDTISPKLFLSAKTLTIQNHPNFVYEQKAVGSNTKSLYVKDSWY